jgi:hypothetical protein
MVARPYVAHTGGHLFLKWRRHGSLLHAVGDHFPVRNFRSTFFCVAAHSWCALSVLNPNFGSLHRELIFRDFIFAYLSEVGFDPVTSGFKNR